VALKHVEKEPNRLGATPRPPPRPARAKGQRFREGATALRRISRPRGRCRSGQAADRARPRVFWRKARADRKSRGGTQPAQPVPAERGLMPFPSPPLAGAMHDRAPRCRTLSFMRHFDSRFLTTSPVRQLRVMRAPSSAGVHRRAPPEIGECLADLGFSRLCHGLVQVGFTMSPGVSLFTQSPR